MTSLALRSPPASARRPLPSSARASSSWAPRPSRPSRPCPSATCAAAALTPSRAVAATTSGRSLSSSSMSKMSPPESSRGQGGSDAGSDQAGSCAGTDGTEGGPPTAAPGESSSAAVALATTGMTTSSPAECCRASAAAASRSRWSAATAAPLQTCGLRGEPSSLGVEIAAAMTPSVVSVRVTRPPSTAHVHDTNAEEPPVPSSAFLSAGWRYGAPSSSTSSSGCELRGVDQV